MRALWKHRHGHFGRTRITFIALFSSLLPLLAPLIGLMAVYGLFFLDRQITIIGWLAMLLVQTVTAILAFRLDRESLRPLWPLPVQQVGYRQVMCAVLLPPPSPR
jgi:hypothetical protein